MLKRRDFIKYLIIFGKSLVVFSLTGCTNTQERQKPPQDSTKLNSAPDIIIEPDFNSTIINDIKKLASDSMQGREAGTVGEIKAAKYITEQMRLLGLNPLGETGYDHVFTIPDFEKTIINNRVVFRAGKSAALRTPCVNLIGELPGTNKGKIILVCAHYDHLGIYNNKIYSGANDNASGVACVIDVLRRLKKGNKALQSTIVFAFWSGEEMGFLGSKAFIERPTFNLNKTKVVFNIDTVGNGITGDYDMWYQDNNLAVKALRNAAKTVNAHVKAAPKSNHNSDQISFAKVGIPAVTLMSRDWLKNNHTIKDTSDVINREQVKRASELIYNAIKIADSY